MLEVVFTAGTISGRTGAMRVLAFNGAALVTHKPPSPRLVLARLPETRI